MSSKKKKLNKRKKYNENKINDNNKAYNHLNNNECNRNRKNEDMKNNLGANTYNLGKISDEDMESLRLLSLQLKAILLDYCGDTLLWNSTVEGIQYILEKYNSLNGDEHTSTLAPDMLALQSSYVFLAAKGIVMRDNVQPVFGF